MVPPSKTVDDPQTLECWHYNKDDIPRENVKLNNPKYCWLYSKLGGKELKNIVPDCQHCLTLYTKCDYLLEQCAHEMILKLEDQFKAHYNLTENEQMIQNELVVDMWVKSQRYLILTRSGICVKPYPEIVSVPTEKRILCNFHQHLRKVKESKYNFYLITKSLEEIRTTMTVLQSCCDGLDITVDSPFIAGTCYLRPLKYIRNMLNDLFNYFYQHLCKLKCWAELLDPGDCAAIEDYMALIKPNKEYEDNLIEYLDQCRCLRSKRKECIKRHIPC